MKKYTIEEAINNPIDFVRTLLDSYNSEWYWAQDIPLKYFLCHRVLYFCPNLIQPRGDNPFHHDRHKLFNLMFQIGITPQAVHRLTPPLLYEEVVCQTTAGAWFVGEEETRISFLQLFLEELKQVQRGRQFLPDVNTYAYPDYNVVIQNTIHIGPQAALDGTNIIYTELQYRKQYTSEKQPFWAYIGKR